MAGTRYGHKLKARLNKGKTHLDTRKGSVRTTFQNSVPEGFITIKELADIFFTTVEKIKKARKAGIIIGEKQTINRCGAQVYLFEKNKAIESLSKFKDKNGFLLI